MGSHERQAGLSQAELQQKRSNREISRKLHQSIFAYLTRPVPDPDRPGESISYGELEQRLRGRAYRQASRAAWQSAQP